MKKTIAIAGFAAAALTMGVAKAEMKYVDVPSGHWAYDAIEQADKMGCWEGYPDGTFRGNRNITRYEMAMIVKRMMDKCFPKAAEAKVIEASKEPEKDAKALAEIDKLKATLKKLEAEFKDEIAALKGNVKKLQDEDKKIWADQKRQDKEIDKIRDMIGNVKISGTIRSRMDSYGSDLNARLAGTALPSDPVVGGAAAGAALAGTGVSTEMGYELFYDVLFKAQVNELTNVVVEFNNWAADLNYGNTLGGGTAGTRTPVVDQAYAALDLTSKTQSLDGLKITAGTQYVSFGPNHLLVDNGWESAPLVRVDVSKDIIDLTAVTGVVDQIGFGGVGAVNPVNAGAGQDAYTVARLGLNLKPAKIGVNYLASGILKEKGWGVDIESPLLRKTNWFNGISGEFYQLTDDRNGRDPGCVRPAVVTPATANCSAPVGSDSMDTGWTVGLDVYKSKKTMLNAYYADIGLTSGLTGAVANPFNEFNAYANTTFAGGASWSYALNPFLFDSYHMISPDFEGFGAKIVHKFSHDLMVSAIARAGDYNSAPALQYPTFGALRVTKGISKDTTFAIDYAQYGNDDIWLNRVRGELVVNF